MRVVQQSTAVRPLTFLMVDSADHRTGKTGLSPTVQISKNGGTFAAPAGAVTEIGLGLYRVAANATDSNTLGSLIVHAEAAGADPSDTEFEVVAYNPREAYISVGTGTGQLTPVSGKVVVTGIDNSTINSNTFLAGAITNTVIANNALTSAKIQDGAFTAAKFATDAFAAAAFAADGIAKIAAGVWDRLLSLHTTAGTTGKKLNDLTSGGGGGTPGNIVPLSFVVNNPLVISKLANGANRLQISQYDTPTIQAGCFSRVGNVDTPTDLSSKDLRVTIYTFNESGAPVGIDQIDDADITVDGTDNNQINFRLSQAATSTVRTMVCHAWDVTDGVGLEKDLGKTIVEVAPSVLTVP